ncbi:unnamed protein product, partial [Owenia fusiformis]
PVHGSPNDSPRNTSTATPPHTQLQPSASAIVTGIVNRLRTRRRINVTAHTSGTTIKKRRGRPPKAKTKAKPAPVPGNTGATCDLATVMMMIRDLTESVNELHALNKTNSDLVKQLARKSADNEELHKENAALRGQIKSNANLPKPKSLLIGSSILRDVDETKLENTDVTCIRGGTISDVHKRLTEKADRYDKIYLQIGSNDCKRNSDVELICENYKMLLKGAKQCCESLVVSSITPRLDDNEAQARVEQVNGFLICHCIDEDVKYIDNDTTFKLQDGSINDGFLAPDHLHLADAGTNRLIKNLNIKTNMSDITKPKETRFPPRRPNQKPNEQLRQTRSTAPPPMNSQTYEAPHQPPRRPSTHATRRPPNHVPQRPSKNSNPKPSLDGYIQTNKPKQSNAYQPPRQHSNMNTDNVQKCFKCSETGHLANSCWHPAMVRCHACKELGHKQSNCPNTHQHHNGQSKLNANHANLAGLRHSYNSEPNYVPSLLTSNRFSVLA